MRTLLTDYVQGVVLDLIERLPPTVEELYRSAAATVVGDYRRRRALPSWFQAEGMLEVGVCGRVTIATMVGTDGIRRFGAARRHWRDEDNPETGGRHAIGRLLAKP